MIYIVRCSNSTVTDHYLDVMAQMLLGSGQKAEDYSEEIKFDKDDIIIVATCIDLAKLYRKGYRKIVLWMQGIESEESYLKHRSKVRKLILDKITKFALRKAAAIFYVSEAMRKFEDRKFKMATGEKSFIMPCFNTSFASETIKTPGKYSKNVFAYVGSLSKWQCFEETVDFYKKMEASLPGCELRVFTAEKAEAKQILEEKGVKNYSIDFVTPEELTMKLAEVKFGFVLREDIAVNRVATPTKLSTYLAAGVIPIFSDCIQDFAERTKNLQYVIPVHQINEIPDKLRALCCGNIDATVLKEEFSELFATYYNPTYYMQNSKDWVTNIKKKLEQ